MTQDFVFVGECLAFDFVNTDVVVRRKPIDLWTTPQDLQEWWTLANQRYDTGSATGVEISAETVHAAKCLRGALRRLFNSLIENRPVLDDDLAIVNQILQTGYAQLGVNADGSMGVKQVTQDNPLLLAVAQSVVWLMTACDRDRLHHCQNEHCVLVFLDTTKNGNRVWCTTDCMNRARSSAHYRQNKSSTGTQ